MAPNDSRHVSLLPNHYPKAGGTSLSKTLRRMMCTRNNGTNMELDCCNPGWCDYVGAKSSIKPSIKFITIVGS